MQSQPRCHSINTPAPTLHPQSSTNRPQDFESDSDAQSGYTVPGYHSDISGAMRSDDNLCSISYAYKRFIRSTAPEISLLLNPDLVGMTSGPPKADGQVHSPGGQTLAPLEKEVLADSRSRGNVLKELPRPSPKLLGAVRLAAVRS